MKAVTALARNAEIDVVQDLVRAVSEIEMLDLDHARGRAPASGRRLWLVDMDL